MLVHAAPPHLSQGRRRIGFTLIELLVVIAILAILAALLFPVFARARAQTRSCKCAHQLRLLAMGMTMYAQDYDGTHVKYLNKVKSPRILDHHWEAMILPYVREERLFLCPDGPEREVEWHTRHWRFTSHYGMNLVGRDPPLSTAFAGNLSLSHDYAVHESEVEDATGTVWLIDADADRVNYDPEDAAMGQNESPQHPGWNDPRMAKRHRGGANAAFVDGHAKWVRRMTPAKWTRRED